MCSRICTTTTVASWKLIGRACLSFRRHYLSTSKQELMQALLMKKHHSHPTSFGTGSSGVFLRRCVRTCMCMPKVSWKAAPTMGQPQNLRLSYSRELRGTYHVMISGMLSKRQWYCCQTTLKSAIWLLKRLASIISTKKPLPHSKDSLNSIKHIKHLLRHLLSNGTYRKAENLLCHNGYTVSVMITSM